MVIFFSVLILISSISIIVTVLFQESKSEGLGAAYGGSSERFFLEGQVQEHLKLCLGR